MNAYVDLPFGSGTYRVRPSKIIAVGQNYRAHLKESPSLLAAGAAGDEPAEPVLFAKLPSSMIGPGQPVVLPRLLADYAFDEERTDYEGELVVVIGSGGAWLDETAAREAILGFTCGNDISQRNIQKSDRSGWMRGKSFDTFMPIGPRIVGIADLPNFEDLAIETRLNGTVVQRGRTSEMIFPLLEIISFISRNFTLEPGDLIMTGTPAGVGPIAHGDRMEVEIEGIGTLVNPVVDSRNG